MRLSLYILLFSYCTVARSQILIPFLQDSLYGYSNLIGDLKIEPQFTEVDWFDENNKYATVRIEDKWYVIDNRGSKIRDKSFDIKPDIKNLEYFGIDFRQATNLRNNDKSIFPEENIIVITPNYHSKDKSNKCIIFNVNSYKSLEITKLSNPLNYGYEKGLKSAYKAGILIATIGQNEYELYDNSLNLIAHSSQRLRLLKNGLLFFYDEAGYLYDPKTKQITKNPFAFLKNNPENEHYIFCSQPRTRIYNKKGKCGVCDSNFNIIIDSLYTYIHPYGQNYVCSNYTEKTISHLMDSQGKKLISNKKYIKGIAGGKYIHVEDTLGKVSLLNIDLSPVEIGSFDKLVWESKYSQFTFKNGKNVGILDSNFVVQFQYKADEIRGTDDPNLFSIRVNNRRGIVTKNKKIVIPTSYSSCYQNSSGYFNLNFITDSRKGLANKSGQIILDTVYNKITIETKNNTIRIYAEIDGNPVYFDESGKAIPKVADQTKIVLEAERQGKSDLTNTRNIQNDKIRFEKGSTNKRGAITKFNRKNGLLVFENASGEGIINEHNELLLLPADRKIIDIEDHYILTETNNQYDLYDTSMNRIYPFSFDYASDRVSISKLRRVSKKIPGSAYKYVDTSCSSNTEDTLTGYKYKYGYVNRFGKISISPNYTFAKDFDNGHALVCKLDEQDIYQCHIIDTINQVVQSFDKGVKPSYNWKYKAPIFLASKGNRQGCIYENGDIAIDFKYKSISDISNFELFVAYDFEGNSYLLNRKGETIYKNIKIENYKWYNITELVDNLVLVNLEDGMQIINKITGEKHLKFDADSPTYERSVELIDVHGLPLIRAFSNQKPFYVNFLNNVAYKN